MVDSDILIEVSRGRDMEVVSPSRQDIVVLYSPISVAELWAGARPAEHDALNRLFDALTCVGVDAATGRQAGDYLRHYGKSHAKLGDALIAAAAVLNHAALWTRNRKHYPMKEVAFF